MERTRHLLLQRIAVVIAGLVAGAMLAGTAWASYWDFSGYLPHNDAYFEYGPAGGCGGGLCYQTRLSRQYCGTKMYLWQWSGGAVIIPFPGGCGQSDYSYSWDPAYYWASECWNKDGPYMWVNCRVGSS